VARRLLSSYSGPLIQVDNTTDFGFTPSGALDTTALLAYAGSNSVYVSKVYDQSGNGNDQVQSTLANAFQIVNSGVLRTSNGFPCGYADTASKTMTAVLGTTITGSAFSGYQVAVSPIAAGGDERFLSGVNNGNPDYSGTNCIGLLYSPSAGSLQALYNFGASGSLVITNGNLFAAGSVISNTTLSMTIGAGVSTSVVAGFSASIDQVVICFAGQCSTGHILIESGVWSVDESPSIDTIVHAANTYYGI